MSARLCLSVLVCVCVRACAHHAYGNTHSRHLFQWFLTLVDEPWVLCEGLAGGAIDLYMKDKCTTIERNDIDNGK